ncbi:MAG: pyruvate kinase [Gemmatimonadota bacterium]|nr:MAG: pyruvate kinase [Gemmatimonadota bacterium]
MGYDPRFRRTKIVATLGPASSDESTLRDMILAGVNVVRINSAHGTSQSRGELIDRVIRLRDEMERHVAVLVDLQGPRIRVGYLADPVQLAEGSEVVFAPENGASGDEIPTAYEALASDVRVGSRILLDDGLLCVEATQIEGNRVVGLVKSGGILRSNKGINLPDDHVSAPPVTDKDRGDIEVALKHGVDLIGISFVSRAEDVEEVRSLVGSNARIVAKVERTAALADIDRIVQAADAIMVARGDLGVELPFEEVPLTQKHLITVAMSECRPVITATQMLESMVYSPRPTRAEVSDVANAILDGTDAVMLSAETAVGEYPVEVVRAMVRIITEVEQAILKDGIPWGRCRGEGKVREAQEVADAIALAAIAAGQTLNAPLILCVTKSGFTARTIAANRPTTPVLGLSTERTTCRFLALVWGVLPLHADVLPSYETLLDVARSRLVDRDYVRPGDRIIVTAGVPFEVPGTTNLIKIETV